MLSIWPKEGEEEKEEEEDEEEEEEVLSMPTALQPQCTLPMVRTWPRS